jgi:hypothetical protein
MDVTSLTPRYNPATGIDEASQLKNK